MKTSECFVKYEKLLHEVAIKTPHRDFSAEKTKEEVISLVRRSLGIRDEWIPEISAEVVRTIAKSSFKVQLLKAESWYGVSTAANLYVPDDASENNKRPLIMICCGHGKHGKLNDAYQTMAAMLAIQGAVVLVTDNVGQGERIPMGHYDCPAVFACGLSVQGLIVMEAVGWLNWASRLPYVDASRMGVTGNSGGGTLAMFLCALYPDLAAACPTGYPCTFDFIARKEKRHCDCNIIPECLGKYEMWDVLGCFAPKPLLIAQGVHDNLFPEDIFYSTARKVKDIYSQSGADKNFDAVTLPGTHSWDAERRNLIARFFMKAFAIEPPVKTSDSDLLSEDDLVFQNWPKKAMTTEQLACELTGKKYPLTCKFEEVFEPRFKLGDSKENHFRPGNTQRIFAQFEAFMKN